MRRPVEVGIGQGDDASARRWWVLLGAGLALALHCFHGSITNLVVERANVEETPLTDLDRAAIDVAVWVGAPLLFVSILVQGWVVTWLERRARLGMVWPALKLGYGFLGHVALVLVAALGGLASGSLLDDRPASLRLAALGAALVCVTAGFHRRRRGPARPSTSGAIWLVIWYGALAWSL